MSNATQNVHLGSHTSGPDTHHFDSTGTTVQLHDLIALSDIVIVDPEKEEVSKGGIVIADVGEAQKVRWGVVVAVGPGRFNEGVFQKMSLVVGDRVMFGKYASAGEPIKIAGKEYRLFREGDLFARTRRDA